MTDRLYRSTSSSHGLAGNGSAGNGSAGNGLSQNVPQGMAEAHDLTAHDPAHDPTYNPAHDPTYNPPHDPIAGKAAAEATAEADSPQQTDLALDIQVLQVLNSSDDCIKILDLEGRILFMSRGGQVLLGIQDIKPFLNTAWTEFWQGTDQQAAREAIAQARAGEVYTFQGNGPTLTGELKWWDIKISPMRGNDGQVERLLCISRDITRSKQAEAALQASEKQFRLFTTASSDIVYKMSADWREVRLIEGKNFLASTQNPNQAWLEQYIPTEEQGRVRAAIGEAIRTKSTFQLEHQVIQQDGTIGWTFSRAIPLLNDQNEIVEWLGAASNVTVRKQAELGAEFLALVTQNLAEATCVEDIIQIVGEQLHRYLQASVCAFIEIDESAELVTIDHCWHQQNEPSLVGVYYLPEFVTAEFCQAAKLGQIFVVRDVKTDPRIVDPAQFAALKIGSLINIPLIRDGAWKFTLGIYHQAPYNWRSDEIGLMRELANRIWTKLERTRIEIALRQSQEMFSTLVADAPLGVYTIDAEFRFQQANQTAVRAFNLQPLIGRDLAEALRIIWQEPFATEAIDRFRHTLATGEPFYSQPIVEPRADIDEIQSYDWQLHRITLSDGSYGVVCYFYDLSEIKRAEEIVRRNGDRDAFLVTLNDALRPLNDSLQIQATASRILGEHLGANRVTYFEVRDADYVVEQDYVNGVKSLRGGYSIESFGAELLDAFRKGRTVVASDVAADSYLSPAQQSAYTAVQNAAHIGVPLVKQGEFVAGLAIHSAHSRNWTPEEIALAEEVAERTWAAVERARAEAALRESEAKYRGLFESLDEGYFLADVLFDEDDRPIDIFYLEANPAATRMVGQDFTGRQLKEIAPNYEAYWYEIFGRVVQTGLGERLEQYAEPDQKWYDFYVFKVGDRNSRRVSVVFKDITERKRRDANLTLLAEVSEAFSQLSTAQEIIQTVGAKLGSYLNLATCHVVEIDEAADRSSVFDCWRVPEAPELAGIYRISDFLTPEIHRTLRAGETVAVSDTLNSSRVKADAYAPTGIRGFVTVPFHRFGKWKYLLSITTLQVRHWRDDELELIQELSNRLFPRLERAYAEASLRKSEEKYRSLFESMDEAYAVVEVMADDNGKWNDFLFLEVNPAFVKQTGMEYPVGRKATELLGTPNPRWAEVYGQVAETGEPIRFEEGEATLGRIFDLYVFRLGGEGCRRVAVLFNDITERKQVEATIAADLRDTQLLRDLSAKLATEESIQALYQEIMAAAIVLTHADAGTVQILDEATQELVLLETQGISQKTVEHFHRINASSNTPCGIALRSGVRSFVDFDVPDSEDPDGSMRFHVEGGLLSAQSTPLISRSGKPIGMVSTHWHTRHRPSERELRFLDLLARQAADLIEQRQDAVQRKQLLEREQAAREEAERANRIKDEFLAVLSHELRSPLNPILGWSKLLQNGKLDSAKTAQALATIERNAKLQSELIEDLLDVSRILRGKLSLNVAPVNLANTIRAAMETVRLAAEAKSITVEATLTPDIGLVLGDSTRLQQVIWNLLSNAVKFTPSGGQVNIQLECFDSSAQITVSDTGQGIAPDFLPYVFDYFRQADGATTRKFGGLGLGLAIVRHLVELHGGTVRADSLGEGQGATFTIRLPLMPSPSQADREERPPQPSLDLNGCKILVVDDEPDTRDLVAFVLEQQGAQVTAVTSAREALLMLPQAKPDILLSDIGMPEMDGYMLIRQVRALAPEQGGQIPAIALTAYAGDTNQQQVIAAGFQKHISKPIEPELLIQTIIHLMAPN
ncbi:GAF domain-containing protein [Leptolyngbya ohadii]|uniref:GAF domain-containing protein n=1 Tax=Leptolyngbya ohadii TaxID=1962290 RepID=UPI00117BA20D|nr:GAF domain-containing protein [Leptolyngbya ohadii]